MVREKVAPQYSSDYLEVDRPQTLSDKKIEATILDVLNGNLDKDISDTVYDNFKKEAEQWILNSSLNNLRGLDQFSRRDIIIGCTQFIDTQYMKGSVQVLTNDYRYHERLGTAFVRDPGNLCAWIPLVVAMPFPSIGAPRADMQEILDECKKKNVDVHIDGAWITCSRDVDFDFTHPAIKSVGISLSKGLGLGWNRIGIRWTRETKADAVTVMNDFNMNNRALAMIGLHFVRNFPCDYLWKEHGDRYYQVCKDFNLTPTQSIHIAMRDRNPVGVSPLIRYLENASSVL